MSTALLQPDLTTTTVGQSKKVRPIVGWAAIGGACLAFEIYLLIRWPLSGDMKHIGSGPTPVPASIKFNVVTQEVLTVVLCILGLYYFLIRPWRRAGHIMSDGLMIIAIGIMFWQDPLGDYVGPWSMYNGYSANLGSWLRGVPGVAFPHPERLAEPIFTTVLGFVGGMFLTIVLGNFLMRKAQERWPSLTNFRLILCVFVAYMFVDFVIEFGNVLEGLYVFPGAVKWASIFPNSRYKFPVYEVVLMSAAYSGFVCLRYFKDEEGYTWVERGVHRLKVQGWRKAWIRFLAMSAMFNIIYFCAYNVPINALSMNSSSFPPAITSKSYLMNGDVICGRGTTFACPGPNIPIPRQHSAHVAPDGRLVPAGQ